MDRHNSVRGRVEWVGHHFYFGRSSTSELVYSRTIRLGCWNVPIWIGFLQVYTIPIFQATWLKTPPNSGTAYSQTSVPQYPESSSLRLNRLEVPPEHRRRCDSPAKNTAAPARPRHVRRGARGSAVRSRVTSLERVWGQRGCKSNIDPPAPSLPSKPYTHP